MTRLVADYVAPPSGCSSTEGRPVSLPWTPFCGKAPRELRPKPPAPPRPVQETWSVTVLRLLQAGPATIAQIAADTGNDRLIVRRNIYRALSRLERSGKVTRARHVRMPGCRSDVWRLA